MASRAKSGHHHVFILVVCFSSLVVIFSSVTPLASSERSERLHQKKVRSRVIHFDGIDDPLREKMEEREMNPSYVWTKEDFLTRYSEEEVGFLRTLPGFFSEGEGEDVLLRGLQGYSLSWVVANPNAMVLPHHAVVDSVLYVCRGKGIIGTVGEEKQEIFDVKEGDVMVISLGKMVFAANSDGKEKLCILNLMRSASVPGRAQAFFGIGAEDQESFFRSFSTEVLEAAFNIGEDRLLKFFENHKHVMEKESTEQIQKLKGGKRRDVGPCRLLEERAWFRSDRGRVYAVDHTHYAPLKQLDVSVSFANVTGGSMLAPSYNSRATTIAIVTHGHGYLEMVCPDAGNSREYGTRYKRTSARLSPMTVFVAPAGHPLAVVAEEEPHIVGFDINSGGNTHFRLAGKNNIFSNLDGVASELAFGSSREAELVLGSQHESIIVEGPRRTRGHETCYSDI